MQSGRHDRLLGIAEMHVTTCTTWLVVSCLSRGLSLVLTLALFLLQTMSSQEVDCSRRHRVIVATLTSSSLWYRLLLATAALYSVNATFASTHDVDSMDVCASGHLCRCSSDVITCAPSTDNSPQLTSFPRLPSDRAASITTMWVRARNKKKMVTLFKSKNSIKWPIKLYTLRTAYNEREASWRNVSVYNEFLLLVMGELHAG